MRIQIQTLSHSEYKKIDMFMDIKAIKVCFRHTCAIIYNLWCPVWKKPKKKPTMILFNIWWKIQIYFGWEKKGNYKHIRLKWGNTNTNIFGLTKKGEDKYKCKYSDWYLQIQIQITNCYLATIVPRCLAIIFAEKTL